MFSFQITTDTEKEAKRFMEVVSAEDVVIEEWTYEKIKGDEILTEVYGFAVTKCLPKYLNRIADSLGVALIFVRTGNIWS